MFKPRINISAKIFQDWYNSKTLEPETFKQYLLQHISPEILYSISDEYLASIDRLEPPRCEKGYELLEDDPQYIRLKKDIALNIFSKYMDLYQDQTEANFMDLIK